MIRCLRTDTDGVINVKHTEHPSPEGLLRSGWIPPAKTLFLATAIDAAMVLSFYAYYYNIATPLLESSMPAIQEAVATVFIDRVIALSLIAIGFFALPCAIYTLFCAIKIPVLARGRAALMPGRWKLIWTNLRLAALATISFTIFEWLGWSLKEGFVVYVAGTFLFAALIFTYLLSCISHSQTWKQAGSPIIRSLSDPRPWKVAMPYLFAIAIEVALLTWVAYILSGKSADPVIVSSITTLAAILASAISNSYQWTLYTPDPL